MSYNIETQHNGTEHLAINNTFVRRFLTRLALHPTAKFYSRDGLCVPISKHKIVKTGRRVHLTEGVAIKYLAGNTAIPVPKVHCSFLHKNRAYIVMERIQGEELSKAWNSMSKESVEGVFAQLRKIFQELRALTPPGTGVESYIKGSLYDSRNRVEIHVLVLFTHGDLNPINVLVCGGNVVGIIGWEFSRWYPHYWDYTSAWFGNVTRTEWQGMLDKVLDRPRPEELRMEEVRNKWWDE
ncbi:kinase-like protein [Lindgomyces ingoldianus]|uniref:Kinase-like protein n=1 Tax=Lindgomyces ingoldianus TaxID=673940 RepID=A0ACB6RJ51_9PLEO|nr:kinase-like protein [Lindgomyces ingoldianus]KAF2478357.1 kinase-like protein [Lindgomyces ingoldianus]